MSTWYYALWIYVTIAAFAGIVYAALGWRRTRTKERAERHEHIDPDSEYERGNGHG